MRQYSQHVSSDGLQCEQNKFTTFDKRINTCANDSNKRSTPLSLQERIKMLEGLVEAQQGRIKTLEVQQAKDSHKSGLPPSSDRFVRVPKSLRQKSGKKLGGQ